MRSPHVPVLFDGSDDRRTEQINWMMRTGYSPAASMGRWILLHDLGVQCAVLFDALDGDPDPVLRQIKKIRELLEKAAL